MEDNKEIIWDNTTYCMCCGKMFIASNPLMDTCPECLQEYCDFISDYEED